MNNSNGKHELLGEVKLALKKMERVSKEEFNLGSYIGSGDGRLLGEKLRGSVLWDLAEAQSALQCSGNFKGKIETDDGAVVEFDVLGFFRRENETSALWGFTGGVTFHTDDTRYAWLHGTQGVWEGQSDLSAYTHTSRIYLSEGQ